MAAPKGYRKAGIGKGKHTVHFYDKPKAKNNKVEDKLPKGMTAEEFKAKYAKVMTENKLQELDLKAEIQELKSLYKHDQSLTTTSPFISGLRASVRPVITYFFFFTFVGVELSVIFNLVDYIILQAIWNENTQGLFAAVLSFWFGSRAMSKVMKDK